MQLKMAREAMAIGQAGNGVAPGGTTEKALRNWRQHDDNVVDTDVDTIRGIFDEDVADVCSGVVASLEPFFNSSSSSSSVSSSFGMSL